jgi:hypothetical protein
MTYFPQDIFQIILDYAGINGISAQQLKMFNRVGVNTLLQLYNQTFQGNVLKLKSRTPALEKRKIILKLLFSSLKYNKPSLFQDMLTLYNLEYKPCYNANFIVLYREYCVEFDNKTTPKIFGVITKINKASFYIRPFAYFYEIIDIQHLIAVKIYNSNHLLQPVMVRLSKVDSLTTIHSGNRNNLLHVRLNMINIPTNEQHLISYI